MEYIKPKMWIIVFETDDVIRTSSGLVTDPNKDPDLGEDEGFDFT